MILRAISLGYAFGFDIMEATGLPSGSVYPALRRLERDALAVSRWESEETATADQRPARRYYEITSAGKAASLLVIERYPLLVRLLPEKRA
jgi:PadR family transcriptional regulator PadR